MRADNLRVLTWTAVGLLGAAVLLAGRWLLHPRDGLGRQIRFPAVSVVPAWGDREPLYIFSSTLVLRDLKDKHRANA